MTDDISLHSIDINGEIYFIQVHFKAEYCCDILLTNVESTWKCDLLKSAIADFAKETGMDLQEYFLLLKAAFTGKSFQKDFHYSISKDSVSQVTLKWKRVQNDVKFCLGTFNFEKTEDFTSAIKYILSTSCKNLNFISSSLEASKRDHDNLKKEYKTLQNDLKKCSTLKEELENELLAKFVLVINEKKAKIRALQEQLANSIPVKSHPLSSAQAKNLVSLSSKLQPGAENESASTSKAIKLKLEDSFEGGSVIPKRKRTANKQPLTFSVSPVKAKETPVSPVRFPSDYTGSSSDSTVDVNELIDEIE